MLLVFLLGLVGMILLRTIRRDYVTLGEEDPEDVCFFVFPSSFCLFIYLFLYYRILVMMLVGNYYIVMYFVLHPN